MSSREAVRGNQEPRIRREPAFLYTDGDDAAQLVSTYGLTPYPWQKTILDAWLGRNAEDRFVCSSCGITMPRQNGKNAVIEMRELYGLCIIGEQILHTAHEVKTARKAFNRLCGFFENDRDYPELAEMVVSIRKTNGQEGIYLTNGASIEFSARTRGASRGFTVDLVVFDEAQELTDEQLEAIMSTMAAAPLGNRQLIYTGTPPTPNSPGEVFARVRGQAVRDEDPRLAWHEWSVPEIGDVSDRSRWYDTNPSMGYRLDEEFTETEYRQMSADGFARERLGWWSDSAVANAVFTEGQWRACLTDIPPQPDDDEIYCIGVKFSSDGSHVAISAAVRKNTRLPYIEGLFYVSMEAGTTWIADWLVQRKHVIAEVVIDGKSNVDSLVNDLDKAGFPIKARKAASTADVIAASSMLYNAVVEQTIQHSGQPLMDESATKSRKRIIGSKEAGGWGFGDGAFASAPIESAALAYRSLLTTKRNPRRKMRVG